MSTMSKRELMTTFILAATAAGGAFFSTNIDAGYQPAFYAAGGAFFATFSALMVAMGIDPRRRPAPEGEVVLGEIEDMHWALGDEEVDRIAAAVARLIRTTGGESA